MNKGLLQFERLDRLFRGIPQSQKRELNLQRKALDRLHQLYQACGSLYLVDHIFCLPKSDDPRYPNRLQVQLPCWVVHDVELRRWILGFGGEVKVVSPQEIIQRIHEMACAIAQSR